MKIDSDKFLECCIIAGCDYLKNVRCVGIHTAFKLHIQEPDVFAELAKRGAPPDYGMMFERAKLAFVHQTVFDPATCKTTHLYEWSTTPSQELQHYCGDYLDNGFGNELAAGNIDPKSGGKKHSFPLLNINNHTLRQGIASLPNTEFEIKIANITDEWLSWQIPCFPVMTIDFYKILFQYNRQEYDGLVMRGQTAYVGRMRCKKQVTININGEDKIVIFEPSRLSMRNGECSEIEVEASDSSDDEQSNKQPIRFDHAYFKVMGTCYCRTRQVALEEAYEHMYEYNRHVYVKLQAEPDNPEDANAIAVLIKSSDSYVKVGN